jgi:putative phage-type endonuclease
MSFGKINNYMNKVIDYINNNNLNKKLELKELQIIKNNVYTELKKTNNEITVNIINSIFDRLYKQKFIVNNDINFNNGKNCYRELEHLFPEVKVPDKYNKLEEHFNKLKNTIQPVQRSKEWFENRKNKITASDTAAAIDNNPYEPVESFILKKCDPTIQFFDNENVYHGKKFELVATMIYEHLYNCKMVEFGALPSDKYSFLGASPDGICSKYTLDNKFCERLGRMLEIKCPVSRYIKTRGNIIGDICPYYYYCQIQQQLLCCSLELCDFWQCNISEYSRDEYLIDTSTSCKTTENTTGDYIEMDNKTKKGIIIEFYPKVFKPEFDEDNIKWKSKYIYPNRLDLNESEYDQWVLHIMNNYKDLYPEIDKDFYFNRIVYWKLNNSHNVIIPRDDNFLNDIIPVLENTWKKVVYYRKNLDKLDELRKTVEFRKKYIKINTNFTIHNENIINNKILFLEDSSTIKPKRKKII